MTNVQLESIRSPFDDPRVASRAVATLIRADAMGLVPRKITCLDDSAIRSLGMGLERAGICRRYLPELDRPTATDPARLAVVLDEICEALDASPAPATEWPALHEVLGAEMLARLVGVSASSARRYLAGTRPIPDAVAVRLHLLALVVADLAGAYNDIGVRRWFDRPRKRLGGSSPARLLAEGWSPDDDGPSRVRELAAGLASSLAT
ncbi:MAG: hypothetical protein OXU77_16615 [Gammaproteobacteria bacterium]|nr:hypothetical protein [Gammaproteobacteria bacterium]MDE0192549.1 hypothetical protein [Gammaproteobacteria bacterium]MDE0443948.1 hypothetical protein [Gammaproteobacteria bacterium]